MAMSKRVKSPKQQKSNVLLLRSSLPSQLFSNVDVLRPGATRGKVYTFDLAVNPQFAGLSAGILKARYQINANVVQMFATLQAAFEEYRIIGLRLNPVLAGSVSVNDNGFMKCWLDDTIVTTAAPTFSDAFSRPTVNVQLDSDVPVRTSSRQEMQWVAGELDDLAFTPRGTTFTPLTLAVFAGPTYTPGTSAGTGTNVASVAAVYFTGSVRVQFRKLATA